MKCVYIIYIYIHRIHCLILVFYIFLLYNLYKMSLPLLMSFTRFHVQWMHNKFLHWPLPRLRRQVPPCKHETESKSKVVRSTSLQTANFIWGNMSRGAWTRWCSWNIPKIMDSSGDPYSKLSLLLSFDLHHLELLPPWPRDLSILGSHSSPCSPTTSLLKDQERPFLKADRPKWQSRKYKKHRLSFWWHHHGILWHDPACHTACQPYRYTTH